MVGLSGFINSVQLREIIEEYALKQVKSSSIENLRESGAAQLRLLRHSVHVALVQSDYATLQTLVHDLGGEGRAQVTAVAVLDAEGAVLAHTNPDRLRTRATGILHRALAARSLVVFPDAVINGQRSMAFAAPITHQVSTEEPDGATGQGSGEPDSGLPTTAGSSRRLGTLFLALSLQPLMDRLARTERVAGQEVRATLRSTLLVGLLSLLVGAVLTVIQAYRMTRPIQALARQADRMAGGDLAARVQVATRDEIGMLGDRFNYMAGRIADLMRQNMKQVEMAKELEVARAVQATLVPAERVSRVGPLTLAGHFQPATQCGGDWWNFFPLEDNRVLVIIGDVTGHGVGSAMITAAARGAASTLVSGARGRIELPSVLGLMNGAVLSAARGDFAMTCFASIIDQRSGTLTYANAGHNPPFLLGSSDGQITPLTQVSDRLGDNPDSRFAVEQVEISSQDTVFWYTDGLEEGTDPEGVPFGDARLVRAIRDGAGLEPEEAMDRIVQLASRHFGDAEQADDITLVVGQIG